MNDKQIDIAVTALDAALGETPYILLIGEAHTRNTAIISTQSQEATNLILTAAAEAYSASHKKQAN